MAAAVVILVEAAELTVVVELLVKQQEAALTPEVVTSGSMSEWWWEDDLERACGFGFLLWVGFGLKFLLDAKVLFGLDGPKLYLVEVTGPWVEAHYS